MLVATHVVTGAAIGALERRRGRAALYGLVAHALLDGVGHDDEALGLVAQGLLGAAAAVAVAATWGPFSSAMVGGLASAAPDGEVGLMLVFGREAVPQRFPSHWPLRGHGLHPWRYPVPGLGIAAEIAVAGAVGAAVCLAGRRRR